MFDIFTLKKLIKCVNNINATREADLNCWWKKSCNNDQVRGHKFWKLIKLYGGIDGDTTN